jgi:hypothetical protein
MAFLQSSCCSSTAAGHRYTTHKLHQHTMLMQQRSSPCTTKLKHHTPLALHGFAVPPFSSLMLLLALLLLLLFLLLLREARQPPTPQLRVWVITRQPLVSLQHEAAWTQQLLCFPLPAQVWASYQQWKHAHAAGNQQPASG